MRNCDRYESKAAAIASLKALVQDWHPVNETASASSSVPSHWIPLDSEGGEPIATRQYSRRARMPTPGDSAPWPTQIGDYRVVGRLGRGGMATVYLAAKKAGLGCAHKLVVLKVLHDEAENVDLFAREADIALLLNHPNVVSTFDASEADGRHFIVMEFLDGAPLSALLSRARDWRPADRIALLVAVCDALAGLHYIHEFRDYHGHHLELVHRDIKPSNIFVTFHGHVKLLDFGIAKPTASVPDTTLGHSVKGTAHYMAPELVVSPHKVDRRTDVYCTGVTMAELLLGVHPLDSFDDARILQGLLRGEHLGALASEETPEGIPSILFRIVRKATSMDPDERYATAADLRREIVDAMEVLGAWDARQKLRAAMDGTFGELRAARDAQISSRIRDVEAEPDESMAPRSPPTRTLAPVPAPMASVGGASVWLGRHVLAVVVACIVVSAILTHWVSQRVFVASQVDSPRARAASAIVPASLRPEPPIDPARQDARFGAPPPPADVGGFAPELAADVAVDLDPTASGDEPLEATEEVVVLGGEDGVGSDAFAQAPLDAAEDMEADANGSGDVEDPSEISRSATKRRSGVKERRGRRRSWTAANKKRSRRKKAAEAPPSAPPAPEESDVFLPMAQ